MNHQIKQIPTSETIKIIHENSFHLIDGEENNIWQHCIMATTVTWVGIVEGKIICMFGIIPLTLLSNRCYLWLSTTEALKGNEFCFVRHSQRCIEDILKDYPEIIGHVRANQSQSKRWLKWLGARFKDPEGLFIPFVIKAK